MKLPEKKKKKKEQVGASFVAINYQKHKKT